MKVSTLALVTFGAVALAAPTHAQTTVWTHPIDLADSGYVPTAHVDAAGDVLVSGYVVHDATHHALIAEKLDPDSGAVVWSAYHVMPTTFMGVPHTLLSPEGDLVFGMTMKYTGSQNGRICRVAGDDGALTGCWDYTIAGTTFTRLNDLTVDSLGRVAAAYGSYVANSTNAHYAVRVMTSTGAVAWTYVGFAQQGWSLAAGLGGDLYLGLYRSALAMRFDAAGSLKWTKTVAPAGASFATIADVVVDASGAPIVVAIGDNNAVLVRELKRNNGATQWSSSQPSGTVALLGLAGGDPILSQANRLARLSATNGATLWAVATSGAGEPIANADGVTLAFGDHLDTFALTTGGLTGSLAVPADAGPLGPPAFDAFSDRGFVLGGGRMVCVGPLPPPPTLCTPVPLGFTAIAFD